MSQRAEASRRVLGTAGPEIAHRPIPDGGSAEAFFEGRVRRDHLLPVPAAGAQAPSEEASSASHAGWPGARVLVDDPSRRSVNIHNVGRVIRAFCPSIETTPAGWTLLLDILRSTTYNTG